MATEGPTPPACDPEIYSKGEVVCMIDGSSNAVERFVKAVAARSDAKVDWHYAGGRAMILHLGDESSRQLALNAIHAMERRLEGRILEVAGPPMAIARTINGQLVLDDPMAEAMIGAVSKINCKGTLALNADRVEHFKQRLADRGMTPEQAVIVILNVDDPNGGQLAEMLMPGHNWQEYRDRGEIPFARGLAMRDGIQEALGIFDKEAADKLHGMSEVSVVVVDHGVAEVFAA